MSVVVAFSPDDYGRSALVHGERQAKAQGVPLVVVNATRGDSYVDAHFAHEAEIAAVRERLAADGVEVDVRREVAPDVAEAVLEVAEEVDASLVVVGVRRRTPVGKMLLGSVAQRVILDAPCPVLSVRPDQ